MGTDSLAVKRHKERTRSGCLWALHGFNEDHSREWHGAAALREVFGPVGIACDEVVVLVFVERVAALGVIDGDCFLVLKVCKPLAPVGDRVGVSDPNLIRVGVVFVTKAKREDLVSTEEEEMGVLVGLGVGVISPNEVAEGVISTRLVIGHGVKMT